MITIEGSKKLAIWQTVEVRVGDTVQRRALHKGKPHLFAGERLVRAIDTIMPVILQEGVSGDFVSAEEDHGF